MGKFRSSALLDSESSTNTTEHSKKIIIRDGLLQLRPLINPCDGLFQVYILTKVMWFLLAELDVDQKTKQLEREVEFATNELQYLFVEVDPLDQGEQEASKGVVVGAILRWVENYVVKQVPESTFQRVLYALEEMKTNCAKEDTQALDTQPHRHHRTHRFQRAINNMYAHKQAYEDMAATIQGDIADDPRPSNVTSNIAVVATSVNNNVLLPKMDTNQKIDLHGLFNSVGMVDLPMDPEAVSQAQGPRRSTRQAVGKKQIVGVERNVNHEEHAAGPRSVQSGEKRSLEQLKQDFVNRHPTNKRRRVLPNDVVSGKGEKAKQQNEKYRELIRANAPMFRATGTGNVEKDLEEKRKIAYHIALTVVDRGGCFLGQDNEPMCAKKAFKRVMTSLKDWRKPGEKRSKKKEHVQPMVAEQQPQEDFDEQQPQEDAPEPQPQQVFQGLEPDVGLEDPQQELLLGPDFDYGGLNDYDWSDFPFM